MFTTYDVLGVASLISREPAASSIISTIIISCPEA
jgi:hypothetical protein